MNINTLTQADVDALQSWDAAITKKHDGIDGGAAAGHVRLGSLLKLLIDTSLAGQASLGVKVINKTGGTLAKGKPVSISGIDIASDQWKIVLTPANTGWCVGVLDADVADGASAVLKSNYLLENIDTSAYGAVGDPAYVTATALSPSGAGAGKNNQVVGYVVTKHASTGSIRILPSNLSPASFAP